MSHSSRTSQETEVSTYSSQRSDKRDLSLLIVAKTLTDPKQPTVRILRPSDSDLSGQNTSLLCFITGFFPSDISVQWQLNGKQFNESFFTNSPVIAHTSGGFSMHSALILPASQSREGVYSCIVSHESSQSPFIASLENLYGGCHQIDISSI